MYDKLLQELFPNLESNAIEQGINSQTKPLSNNLFFSPPNYYQSVLDFSIGEYNLEHIISYYISYSFPSNFAQENLLYVQMLASDLNDINHYTIRKGLNSWLCVQTFYGTGYLSYEGKSYELHCGDVFFINCMREHEYHTVSKEGWGYRIIHFNGAILPGLFERFLECGQFVFHFEENHLFYSYTKKLFHVSAFDTPDKEIEEHRLLTNLVMTMMKQLPAFQATTYPDRIIQIRKYIADHCTEPLTLEQISEQFNINPHYLCRDYKKHTGQTVFQYVLQLRMDIATYLLIHSDFPIDEISRRCGYDEVNSFFYAFKKYTSLSPSSYRRLHL